MPYFFIPILGTFPINIFDSCCSFIITSRSCALRAQERLSACGFAIFFFLYGGPSAPLPNLHFLRLRNFFPPQPSLPTASQFFLYGGPSAPLPNLHFLRLRNFFPPQPSLPTASQFFLYGGPSAPLPN